MSAEKQIFTLKQVASSIQKVIAERYQQNYWVQAEMFKLNYTQKGHCFPELVHKEDGKIVCEMRANIWNANYLRISKNFAEVVKEPLRDGMNLLLLVKISFHPLYGMSLDILDIDPTYSLGELQKEREETLKKLNQEGILNKNQLLDFPLLPKRLAIISVESSKGFKDFCTLIHNNPWKYKFVYKLFTAQLNGDAAIPSIISQLEAIQKLKQHFDAVLIIRGGGGEIGLSCYNNYELSKAIATFPLPILTGIGHSTNITVSEMIAYKNAITPSDLADFLISIFREFDLEIKDLSQRLKGETQKLVLKQKNELRQEIKQFKYASTQLLQENKHNLASLKQQIVQKTISFTNFKEAQLKQIQVFLQTRTKFSTYNQLEKLKMTQTNLRKYVGLQMQQKHNLISDNSLYILQHVPKLFIKQNEELQQIEKNLQLVDPQNVLKRGYSMVLNKDKRLVNSQNIQVEEEIEIINFDSKITSKVLKITQNG